MKLDLINQWLAHIQQQFSFEECYKNLSFRATTTSFAYSACKRGRCCPDWDLLDTQDYEVETMRYVITTENAADYYWYMIHWLITI